MLLQETFVNETKGYIFSVGDAYEPWTDNIGRLFRDMQKEYGRCVSKQYIEQPDGTSKATGWVFSKRMTYDDCHRGWSSSYIHKHTEDCYYTREVWVTVLDKPDTVTRERHYHDFAA